MKDKPEQQIPETGKDEMNLVEFPITLLSKRHESEEKTIEFYDTITGKGGAPTKRQWTVTGSDKYGLPLAQDNDVLLALLLVGKKQKFSSKKIHFSRYRLLKIMGMKTGQGSNYKRIEEALDRLMGVRIKAKNAFWDNERKGYVTKAFGIIESYELFDSSVPKAITQDSFPFSYVNLNDELFESIKAGYIKSIDAGIYFKLNSAIAKRLYRYLDKKRYDGKRMFEIDLFTLAHTHIGFDRDTYKYGSLIKNKLNPAHQELIDTGFLKSVAYKETADKTSEKVIYTFGKKAEIPEPARTEPAISDQEEHLDELPGDLLNELLGIGIDQKVAEQILREYPEEAVREQIEALPHRRAEDPPAVLIASIRGNWTMPGSYMGKQRSDRQEASELEKRRQEEKQKAEHRERIEKHKDSLSREELAELTRQARELAKKEGGTYYREREVPLYVISGYLHGLIEKRLEQ